MLSLDIQDGGSKMRLIHEIAILTGATAGIGRSTAILFAKEGAKGGDCGRRENEAEETVKMAKQTGGEGIFVKADVSKECEVKAMVTKALQTYGRVHSV